MFPVKYALIAVAILIILYLLYNFNKKSTEIVQPKTLESDIGETIEKESVAVVTENDVKLGVYYTDWCGYSRQFLGQLQNGLGQSIENAGASVVLVDCEKNKDVCNSLQIEGFPTLILHTNRGNIPYKGQRDESSIVSFVKSVKSN
jgi:hypothetical protein